jgi:gliding motility-associated-like protein
MQKRLFTYLFFAVVCSNAQTALYNSGNLQIHTEGQMGFHIDLINDGSFDENEGLVGFYGDLPLTVSGVFATTFFDIEISNPDNVRLNTSLNSRNTTNFILGDFFTPRAQTDNYLNFLENGITNGSGDISKVDGYAAVSNQQNFTFPVGDQVFLRPLALQSNGVNTFAKCAYFFENPNSPSTFSESFDTNQKVASLGEVSTREFWKIEGTVPSTIQITWNNRSNIGAIVDDPSSLGIVGWRKSTNQWVSISGGPGVGDLTQGFVTSTTFIPDDYEIITFAGNLGEASELIQTDNYFVSPNGDGVNDALEIEEINLSPNNSLKIFDRYGLKVFEMENYSNTEFTGVANTNNFVIAKDKGLPSGVYFYIISLEDIGLDFQGFLYLARESN